MPAQSRSDHPKIAVRLQPTDRVHQKTFPAHEDRRDRTFCLAAGRQLPQSLRVKLTSSRWVHRFVIALIVLTALVLALQGLDHLLSRRFETNEQEQQERRTMQKAQWVKTE